MIFGPWMRGSSNMRAKSASPSCLRSLYISFMSSISVCGTSSNSESMLNMRFRSSSTTSSPGAKTPSGERPSSCRPSQVEKKVLSSICILASAAGRGALRRSGACEGMDAGCHAMAPAKSSTTAGTTPRETMESSQDRGGPGPEC
eukprot:CAMPEP_0206154448 /NCGR_PEP_ID=MMETSP1474-20131121/1387_1 /ASSEMBLY_ACC=CAM_ASM_001110 /TAXON_ID=97495 /ORGANISM="Imantonia sp., Strain RCC918" /LENGTH=144 /DNA_ID=CAMNT_0053552667 /DNA_START=406 /DNA_END=840 /DNA_ORIENTATION=+